MDAPRRNRPARSRREQALRAEARTVSRFLRGMAQLQAHRGSQPSRIGAAIASALREAHEKAEKPRSSAASATEPTAIAASATGPAPSPSAASATGPTATLFVASATGTLTASEERPPLRKRGRVGAEEMGPAAAEAHTQAEGTDTRTEEAAVQTELVTGRDAPVSPPSSKLSGVVVHVAASFAWVKPLGPVPSEMNSEMRSLEADRGRQFCGGITGEVIHVALADV